MSFDKLYRRNSTPVMSGIERRNSSIMLVEPDPALRNNTRQMLIALGFGQVSDASDHAQALKKFEERPVSHLIFEAKKTNISASEFLKRILEYDEHVVLIPASWEPSLDDVFTLLITGARGYLVKPYTEGALDDAIVMATKGEPISEAILYAKNRNEALASLIMTAVDRLAVTLRQSQQFETARIEIPKRELALKRAVDIGHTFADGGVVALLESLVEFCLDRGNGPATRLGRIRRNRSTARQTSPAAVVPKPEEQATETNAATDQTSSTDSPVGSPTPVEPDPA